MSDDRSYINYVEERVTEIVVREPQRPPEKNAFHEHWCEHESCKNWGSFGYTNRYGIEWFCMQHRGDGEAKRR